MSILRKFFKDRTGNFGIMTALTIPVLIVSSGMALNVATALNAKRQLQAASDSASLAVSEAYNQGKTSQKEMDAVAARFMKTNTKTAGIVPSSLRFTVSVSGSPKLAHVNARAEVPTSFSAFMGRDTMEITAATTTTIGIKNYYQIAFLVDISASMGIGGTDADMEKLYKLIGCEFACHDPNHYNKWGKGDTVAMAKAEGIKLKFDYVQSALNIFVNTLKPAATQNPDKFQLGVYTMATDFKSVGAMTTNMTKFMGDASKVSLEKMRPWSCEIDLGISDIKGGLSKIIPKLQNVGDGSSPAKRKTFVVMITDGVQNVQQDCKRHPSADYSEYCENLKNTGVDVLTIQTNYPAIKHPDEFDQYTLAVKPILNDVKSTLKNCASSPDKFFMADDGPAIEAAIKDVFISIFGNVRITG
jgi:Flp pilus assembly protein TadG